MRTFKLVRNEDETGVSGIGVVAEGCQFSTGVCVLCWLDEQLSLKIYGSIEDVERVHGHGGKTVIEWDEADRHLADLLFLIDEFVSFDDFKNGVEHQGVDEGQVSAGNMIGRASSYLTKKYGSDRPSFGKEKKGGCECFYLSVE